MKRDIDSIMQANNIDVLLVVGSGQHNPAMVYLTSGGHFTIADLIKKRGKKAVLFHHAMERDEAAAAAERSGLLLRSYSKYPMATFHKKAGGDRVLAAAMRYQQMFTDLGINGGRLALFGRVELAQSFPIFLELQKLMPDLVLVGDVGNIILGTAMLTKDRHEIERIRQMGKITVNVVSRVADFLTSQHVGPDEARLDETGQPVTIGRVKGLINLWLAERGAENPEGTIFAIGHDAGVPHSAGKPEDVIRLGQPIVFDIYPCEAGGGYFFDFTRTWCLGYAPDLVQGIYDQVRTVFQTVQAEMKAGTRYADYEVLACNMFEEMGHATILNQPDTEEGLVHGLGHGVGLRIHERPSSSPLAPPEDVLAPGSVVTVEPGLYYPERGLGVRLEDTVYVREDGTIEVLVPYPLDLVLPMKK